MLQSGAPKNMKYDLLYSLKGVPKAEKAQIRTILLDNIGLFSKHIPSMSLTPNSETTLWWQKMSSW
jgi:hypothetical protein